MIFQELVQSGDYTLKKIWKLAKVVIMLTKVLQNEITIYLEQLLSENILQEC